MRSRTSAGHSSGTLQAILYILPLSFSSSLFLFIFEPMFSFSLWISRLRRLRQCWMRSRTSAGHSSGTLQFIRLSFPLSGHVSSLLCFSGYVSSQHSRSCLVSRWSRLRQCWTRSRTPAGHSSGTLQAACCFFLFFVRPSWKACCLLWSHAAKSRRRQPTDLRRADATYSAWLTSSAAAADDRVLVSLNSQTSNPNLKSVPWRQCASACQPPTPEPNPQSRT